MRPSQRILLTGVLVLLVGGSAWWWLRRGDAGKSARTVVLLTIDTLRRDHVGAYGAKAPTPRIDALAAEGTRFEDARTPVPLTLPAHTTMLTGLPPARHGVRSNSASRVPPANKRGFALVAERFSAAGRKTGAFISAGPLVRRYGLDQGFSAYDDGDLDDRTALVYAERAGAETVEHALAWLRSLPADADAFLWVHIFEPHEPHPLGLSTAEAYEADVQAADAAVGLLLDGLAAAGRGDSSILLAADHGESLGEDGEPNHGFLLGESVLRVPLILRGDRVPRGAIRRDPADLADIAPTLLALGGLDAGSIPDAVGCGKSLLGTPLPPDRVRVAESFHAFHQFRWAQLSCASASGWKLEDRGEGREIFGAVARADETTEFGGFPLSAMSGLSEALRLYREAETRPPGPGGGAAGGYGAGGAVGPFIPPAENARRPDPYAVIADAGRLNEIAAILGLANQPPGRLEAALSEVSKIEGRDAGNPTVHFLKGRCLKALGRLPEAVEAFRRAFELGRKDAETLFLWADSIAAQKKPEEALALLESLDSKVPPDTRVFVFEARLCHDLTLPEREKAACQKARTAVRGARDEALLAKTCR